MKSLNVQRLRRFTLLFVLNLSVANFALLSSLPLVKTPISPVPAVSSAALPPPPPSASASPERSIIAPVVIDATNEKMADVMGGAQRDDVAKNAHVQSAMTALANLEKLVSQFHALEESIDTNYVAFDKKIDVGFQDVFAALGKNASLIDGVAAAVVEKNVELSGALDEGSKMIASLKALQISFDQDEDKIRQLVLDFKKKRSDFSAQYSKASSLKNDILVQTGDGKAQADQIAEILIKTKNLYDQANSKEAPEILSLIKKLEEGILRVTSDIAALNVQSEKITKLFTVIQRKQLPESLLSEAASSQDSRSKSVQKVEKESLNVMVEGQGKNMAFAVIETIGQGIKSVWMGFVKRLQLIRSKRISAALTPAEAEAEARVLSEKKSGLRLAARGFLVGSWLLCTSAFDYLRQVFAQLALRSARVAGAAGESVASSANVSSVAVALSAPSLKP